MGALVGPDDPREERELPAQCPHALRLGVEGGLEVLEGERVVEDRHVAPALGLRALGHEAEQRSAAEDAAAQQAGAREEAGAGVLRGPLGGLADRPVGVDLLQGQSHLAVHARVLPHADWMKPVAATARSICLLVLARSKARGAGYSREPPE